jgi:hypothetical protein
MEIMSVISEDRVEPIDTWWCKMSIIINESTLLYNGTCPKERKRFVKEFPDGLELTLENIALARSRGFAIWLPGVCLCEIDLNNVDLSEACLIGANLTKGNLTNANLSEANLYRADLSKTNLTRADLTGANLRGADLTEANLTEADLTRAALGDWERGPDGIARRKRCLSKSQSLS